MRGGRGRPIYSDELLEDAWEYVDNYERHGYVLPTITGLANVLGVTRKSIHAWCHDVDKEEWAFMVDQLLCEQERQLWNKGLRGEFNTTICKLLLARHGYHEKAAVEHSGPGGGPITRIIREMTPEEASRIYHERLRGS